jgi:hypothetical protein
VIGLGFHYGFTPQLGFIFQDIGLGTNVYEGYFQWYPTRKAFYLGLGLGQQDLILHATDTTLTPNVDLTYQMTYTFLTPQIGWRWEWPVGFVLGLSIGVQIPLGSATTTLITIPTVSAGSLGTIRSTIDGYTSLLSWLPLPSLTLLHLGWRF